MNNIINFLKLFLDQLKSILVSLGMGFVIVIIACVVIIIVFSIRIHKKNKLSNNQNTDSKDKPKHVFEINEKMVDRRISRFLIKSSYEYLSNSEIDTHAVLYFKGIAGIGKSYLIDHLGYILYGDNKKDYKNTIVAKHDFAVDEKKQIPFSTINTLLSIYKQIHSKDKNADFNLFLYALNCYCSKYNIKELDYQDSSGSSVSNNVLDICSDINIIFKFIKIFNLNKFLDTILIKMLEKSSIDKEYYEDIKTLNKSGSSFSQRDFAKKIEEYFVYDYNNYIKTRKSKFPIIICLDSLERVLKSADLSVNEANNSSVDLIKTIYDHSENEKDGIIFKLYHTLWIINSKNSGSYLKDEDCVLVDVKQYSEDYSLSYLKIFDREPINVRSINYSFLSDEIDSVLQTKMNNNYILSYELSPFKEKHTKEYLNNNGITNDEIIYKVSQLSDGNPYFITRYIQKINENKEKALDILSKPINDEDVMNRYIDTYFDGKSCKMIYNMAILGSWKKEELFKLYDERTNHDDLNVIYKNIINETFIEKVENGKCRFKDSIRQFICNSKNTLEKVIDFDAVLNRTIDLYKELLVNIKSNDVLYMYQRIFDTLDIIDLISDEKKKDGLFNKILELVKNNNAMISDKGKYLSLLDRLKNAGLTDALTVEYGKQDTLRILNYDNEKTLTSRYEMICNDWSNKVSDKDASSCCANLFYIFLLFVRFINSKDKTNYKVYLDDFKDKYKDISTLLKSLNKSNNSNDGIFEITDIIPLLYDSFTKKKISVDNVLNKLNSINLEKNHYIDINSLQSFEIARANLFYENGDYKSSKIMYKKVIEQMSNNVADISAFQYLVDFYFKSILKENLNIEDIAQAYIEVYKMYPKDSFKNIKFINSILANSLLTLYSNKDNLLTLEQYNGIVGVINKYYIENELILDNIFRTNIMLNSSLITDDAKEYLKQFMPEVHESYRELISNFENQYDEDDIDRLKVDCAITVFNFKLKGEIKDECGLYYKICNQIISNYTFSADEKDYLSKCLKLLTYCYYYDDVVKLYKKYIGSVRFNFTQNMQKFKEILSIFINYIYLWIDENNSVATYYGKIYRESLKISKDKLSILTEKFAEHYIEIFKAADDKKQINEYLNHITTEIKAIYEINGEYKEECLFLYKMYSTFKKGYKGTTLKYKRILDELNDIASDGAKYDYLDIDYAFAFRYYSNNNLYKDQFTNSVDKIRDLAIDAIKFCNIFIDEYLDNDPANFIDGKRADWLPCALCSLRLSNNYDEIISIYQKLVNKFIEKFDKAKKEDIEYFNSLKADFIDAFNKVKDKSISESYISKINEVSEKFI